jgi:hypothetical protein
MPAASAIGSSSARTYSDQSALEPRKTREEEPQAPDSADVIPQRELHDALTSSSGRVHHHFLGIQRLGRKRAPRPADQDSAPPPDHEPVGLDDQRGFEQTLQQNQNRNETAEPYPGTKQLRHE